MSGIMNIALLLGLMQVVKHFDLASDSNRRPIQMIFGTVQISIIALLFYIRSRAQKNNSKTKVHVPKSAKGPAKTMTESEYDVSETESAIKSALVTLAIITGIHMYWGTLQPMIFQSILPLKNVLWDAPVARIYIWGDKATGKLERPFKVDSPLASFMENAAGAAEAEVKEVTDGKDAKDAKKEVKETKKVK